MISVGLTPWYIPSRNVFISSPKNVYRNVQSSICNCQNWKLPEDSSVVEGRLRYILTPLEL